MRSRCLVALSVAVVLLAPGVASAAPPASHSLEGPVARSQPGSIPKYLTVVSNGKPGTARTQILMAIGADGTKRPVLARRVAANETGRIELRDWSADGRTALLSVVRRGIAPTVLTVDVRSGAAQARPLDPILDMVLLRPGTRALLAAGYVDEGRYSDALYRVAPDGRATSLGGTVNGPLLPAADGRTVVTGGGGWHRDTFRVLSATTGKVLSLSATKGHCQPIRWWSARLVLARCAAVEDTNLSLIDPATGAQTALTRGKVVPHDTGHEAARSLESGLFVQVLGRWLPSGRGPRSFLARQDGESLTAIDVPGLAGDVVLVSRRGQTLVLRHQVGRPGAPRSALTAFDPSTGKDRVLTVLGADRTFGRILVRGERLALPN